MLAYEKQTLGFFITKHPLTQHEALVRNFSTTDTAGLKQLGDNNRVIVGGLISRLRTVPIRTGRNAGKKMLIVTLEDFAGGIEATVFSEHLAELQPFLRPDAVVFIDGTVDRRREEPSIRVNAVIPIEMARQQLTRRLLLRVSSAAAPETLPRVRELVRRHRGRCELLLQVPTPDGWFATVRAADTPVEPNDELLGALVAVEGVSGVYCRGARGVVACA